MFYILLLFMDLLLTLIGLRGWAFLIGQKGDFLRVLFVLFVWLILNVFVQINIKEINSMAVLAKHVKTFTPPEVRWEKIFKKFLYLIYSFPKAKCVETAPSRCVLICWEIKPLFDWQCAPRHSFSSCKGL